MAFDLAEERYRTYTWLSLMFRWLYSSPLTLTNSLFAFASSLSIHSIRQVVLHQRQMGDPTMDFSIWAPQYPLGTFDSTREEWHYSVFNSAFAIPFALVVISISIQAVHLLVTYTLCLRRRFIHGHSPDWQTGQSSSSELSYNPATIYYLFDQRKVSNGLAIFAYSVARMLGCFLLLSLSLRTLFECPGVRERRNMAELTGLLSKCPEAFMAVTYLYSFILTIVSMFFIKWTVSATRHNIVLLLSVSVVYMYRDIWPLATYTDSPKDANDHLLWFKFAPLVLSAWFVPLFIPRQYIPVDPKDPMPVPNDEQTCSIFSLVFFFYLDPVIFLGYKVEHMTAEQLPPLSDTDRSKILVGNAFPHMDIYQGAKKRHIVFGLLRAFRKEYAVMAFCVVGQVVLGFFSPVGINKILTYIETRGEGATIRPWFWILCLFVGPAFNSLLFQWYIFMATKALAHAEALITELVFEHSLRIRLVSETEGSSRGSVESRGSATPDTVSVSKSSTTVAESVSTSKNGSNSSPDAKPATASTSEQSKGKAKAATAQPSVTVKPGQGSPRKTSSNLIGKINNLVTTDLGNITDARDFLLLILAAPLQISACIFFLYRLLGWSSFVGLGAMILCLPIPGYAAKLLQDVQRNRMKMTDARVQDVTEVISVLRMVKLFGWEGDMSKRIKEKRDQELSAIWKYKILSLITGLSNTLIPNITMIATYATYTVIMKKSLTPSIIFSSVTVFSMLRTQLQRIQWQISENIQGKVSLDRITDFLQNTEVLDSFDLIVAHNSASIVEVVEDDDDDDRIGFNNANFSWQLEPNDIPGTPSRRSYRLQIDGELLFKTNCINLIVGPTGSGKTSILMALLGEMHFIQSTPGSWFHLPRKAGVAYAAQESWVQNETIRENIIFGSEYDEDRYRKVIYQCALERDIELFEAGDATEVGEKGITLSGGQKARITLARAIYSKANILLLDDVLAALDVHTAVWIVNKCFRGDLVRGRTILLVTHNVAMVAPIASFIVSLATDGTIKAQGSDARAVLESDHAFAEEMQEIEEEIEMAMKEGPSGKLVVSEEVAKGHVTWRSIKLFLTALGGDYAFVFFCLLISLYLVSNWTRTFQTWFLGYWGSQYERQSPEDVKTFLFLTFYSLIVLGSMSLSFAAYVYYMYGTMRASRTINTMLVDSALSSTLRWLDETPTSRIIARCTQDIRALDGPLAVEFLEMVNIAIGMITNVGVIIIFIPVFLSPGIAVAALGMYLGNMYLRAQLSVKREKSNARAPVLAHFGAAITGLVSVRAYGVQDAFRVESLKRIDHYIRISRISYNLNRWVGTRITFLGSLFTVAIASYLVYGTSLGSSNTGFTLSVAAEFCSMILYWVRVFNEFEVQSNSLERIQDYIDIDHEPSPTEQGKPPAAWPTSGELVVENLSARYSKNGPAVLHDVSFHIKSGQRVGVVGRTGSGKSSLTLALLRCIINEGTVYYDGMDTKKVNLDALRSNITIIPQTPELISGTLRRNLDPFELYDDAVLNDALRSAGLFSAHDDVADGRITLDTNISAGGSNISVGERQIIALARAIIRGSKLLILDEATSAIDYKTDAIIQTTLRRQLGPGVTVITVAHRLQTIMDADIIMVLDEGRIVEFDSPKTLLQKEGGKFKGLVDESGDKGALYLMAERDSSSIN